MRTRETCHLGTDSIYQRHIIFLPIRIRIPIPIPIHSCLRDHNSNIVGSHVLYLWTDRKQTDHSGIQQHSQCLLRLTYIEEGILSRKQTATDLWSLYRQGGWGHGTEHDYGTHHHSGAVQIGFQGPFQSEDVSYISYLGENMVLAS